MSESGGITGGGGGDPKLGPEILTSRFGLDQSWTLQTYLANSGYDGLRKALAMTPEEIRSVNLGLEHSRPGRSRL